MHTHSVHNVIFRSRWCFEEEKNRFANEEGAQIFFPHKWDLGVKAAGAFTGSGYPEVVCYSNITDLILIFTCKYPMI